MTETERLEERRIGNTTVLFGERGGKYPSGNSLVVKGSQESLILDPSLGMVARRDALPRVDRVVNSHCHEDHIAGNFLFPDVPWHVHEQDVVGLRSIDDMMAIYEYSPETARHFRKAVLETFHYQARPDAQPFRDGQVFDLGGGVTATAIWAPGHTRGHCVFHIEPDDVLYLADVDLSSFGPYYGDAWSDLESFERTLVALRKLRARHYATFHHIGVIDGHEAFLERFDRFAAVIGDRERRLLEFLALPHDLDEIVEHRFVFRPGAPVAFAADVERRSMGFHVERLLASGRLEQVEPGRYRARSA